MRSSLQIDVVDHGRTTTVTLTGSLDVATAPRLHGLALGDARFVTVDLSGVHFADVSGWHALRAVAADLAEQGVAVTQVGAPRSLDRLDAVLVGLDVCRRHPGRPACAA